MKKIGDVTTTADQNGEFTNGNVAAGIAPTILEADWFNSAQREILNVLLKAKITQNPDVDDQLAQAIEALAKDIAGIEIKQETGDLSTAVMSQKACTDILAKKNSEEEIVAGGISIIYGNPTFTFKTTLDNSYAVFELEPDKKDRNRTILSSQGDAIRNITASTNYSGDQALLTAGANPTGAFKKGRTYPRNLSDNPGTTYALDFDASRVVPTANENRPRNIAYLYIVRAA